MLTFSARTWRNWLNPTSNLNRFRLWDYRRVFEAHFTRIEIEVLARDPEALERVRARIRPGFLSGDPQDDAVTLICIVAPGAKQV